MSLIEMLSGGERRSLGRVEEVITAVGEDPSLFDEIVHAMLDDDPVVAMRAADATEKLTRDHPERLAPYKNLLIEQLSFVEQQEVRWHVAIMFVRLDLTRSERHTVVEILTGWLNNRSSIVKTHAMQGLADLAERDPSLLPDLLPIIEECTASGTPAMRARGRKLLKNLRDES